jgi:hypothetical protein
MGQKGFLVEFTGPLRIRSRSWLAISLSSRYSEYKEPNLLGQDEVSGRAAS